MTSPRPNVGSDHLATAIASSRRNSIHPQSHACCGASEPPSNGRQGHWALITPLTPSLKMLGVRSVFSLATTLLRLIWPLQASHWNGTKLMAGVIMSLEVPLLGTSIQWRGNFHWALSVSVSIPRRHSKQRPDSSYEGEESDQRYMSGGRQ